jgi:hypothetical protein
MLCVVACGLEPRSALESGSASRSRMQRIGHALRESDYSIHDLTRAFGDLDQGNLARLNMPFEFGMAFLFAENATELGRDHEWCALLPESHPYGEFISDLAGYDLETHGGTPESIIPPVLSWLWTRDVGPQPPDLNPITLIGMMEELIVLVEAAERSWAGHLPFQELVRVIRDLVASRLGEGES